MKRSLHQFVLFTLFLFGMLLGGCSSEEDVASGEGGEPFVLDDLPADTFGPTEELSPDGECPEYDDPQELGEVESNRAEEVSGIAVSRRNPDVIWGHNDSGGGHHLFAFSTNGTHLGDFKLDGADNEDWEDIALGPGPVDGRDYIYVADIGDNDRERDNLLLYRLEEPAVDVDDPMDDTVDIDEWEAIELVYDDDEGHDAEAIFVDPMWGDVYVVTKSQNGDRKTKVFVAVAPLEPDKPNLLVRILDEDDAEDLDGHVVGGDISPDGQRIVLLFEEDDARLWYRPDFAPLWAAFVFEPCDVPRPDGHFEAVAFDPEGHDLYMVPEGDNPEIVLIALDDR